MNAISMNAICTQVLLHCDGKIQVYYDKIDAGSQSIFVGLSSGAQPSRVAEYDLSGCGDMPIPPQTPPPTSVPTPSPSPAPTTAPSPSPSPTPPTVTQPPSTTPPPGEAPFCGWNNCQSKFEGPWCSSNKLRCEGPCTGEWCIPGVEPETFFCGSKDCRTKMGPWCANNQGRCESSCGGEWCPDKPGITTPAPTPDPTPAPTTAPTPAPTSKPEVSFCGTNSQCQSKFTGPWCSSTEGRCKSCGGHWCSEDGGPDEPNPEPTGFCGFRQCTKLAGPWCNIKEGNCVNGCKGTWCPS